MTTVSTRPPGQPAPDIRPGAVAVNWSSIASNLTAIDDVDQAFEARLSQVHCYSLPVSRPHRAPA